MSGRVSIRGNAEYKRGVRMFVSFRSMRQSWLPLLLVVGLVPASVQLGARRADAQQCVGDCNGDGKVTIDELILGVNIALGTQSVDVCPAFDVNSDGQVTIDELVSAVNNALDGCPATATPTDTLTQTPVAGTPTPTHSLTPANTPTGTPGTPTATATATETSPPATVSATPTDTPAPQAEIMIGVVAGSAGTTVQVDVELTALQDVLATDNDISFDPHAAIGMTAGTVACAVNPAIGKDGSTFTVLPQSCPPFDTCIHASIAGGTDPIPNGSVLYTCDVEIAADTPDGIYPLACSNPSATGVSGPLTTVCRNGMVIVGTPPTPTLPVPPTETPPPGETQTSTPTPTATEIPTSSPTPTATTDADRDPRGSQLLLHRAQPGNGRHGGIGGRLVDATG